MNSSLPLEIDMESNREYVSMKVYINENFKNEHRKLHNSLILKEKIIEPFKKNGLTLKEKIIELLKEKELTLTEMSKVLGYTSIPNSLRRNLDILQTEGVIKKVNKKYSSR